MIRRARASVALALVLAAPAAAQQSAPDLGTLAAPVRAAAGVASLSTADADPAGDTRWVAWQEGEGDGGAAYLALFRAGNATWATRWANGYAPRLRALPEWSHRGGAVAAVTVSFGAGAVEVDVFGLGRDGRPTLLAQQEAAGAEWRTRADGVPVLMLYARVGATMRARCLGWQETTATLRPVRCPV